MTPSELANIIGKKVLVSRLTQYGKLRYDERIAIGFTTDGLLIKVITDKWSYFIFGHHDWVEAMNVKTTMIATPVSFISIF